MPSCHSVSTEVVVTMPSTEHHNGTGHLQAEANQGDGAQHMGFVEPLLTCFGGDTTTQEAVVTDQG